MWIVSQDGRSIVNMDQVYGIEQQGSSITALLDSHSYKALGYYYTDGKAASVMEQIVAAKQGSLFAYGVKANDTSESARSIKDGNIIRCDPLKSETEYLGSDDVVFRMPQDEDVVV